MKSLFTRTLHPSDTIVKLIAACRSDRAILANLHLNFRAGFRWLTELPGDDQE